MEDTDALGDGDGDYETIEEEEIKEEVANKEKKYFTETNLPKSVKRRIKALKKIQFESSYIETSYFQELHDLECKYNKLYIPLHEKRKIIVNGNYEPTDEESEWSSDFEVEFPESIRKVFKTPYKEDTKGIPDFWLTVFTNVGMLAGIVQPHDMPILKHLVDVKVIDRDTPLNFVIEFHFSPNEYFTNSVLTKEYVTKDTPPEKDPFNSSRPDIRPKGCDINWKEDKDVTVSFSFFNFFTSPIIPDTFNREDIDDNLSELLYTDFEIGNFIRGRIVPRAILFYTGEEFDEDDEEYEDTTASDETEE